MKLSEIHKRLKSLPGWKYSARRKSICVQLKLKDFSAAVRLIGKIARLAEAMDHHPDLHLTRYRRLKIVLTTHSAGHVTSKDFKLAGKIGKV